MSLDTNFNVNPYFDDFNEDKKYYRILFKPVTPVQARELTQLQTILQNQIERFGNHIFKDGTVVDGCGITEYKRLDFVRLRDAAANGALLDIAQLQGTIVESVATGLQGSVMAVKAGNQVNYPETNRVYVRFTNSGEDTEGNDVKFFLPNEELRFYTGPRSANVVLATINTYANVAANTYTSDWATGLAISDGIVYQKGFFVKVDPQMIVLGDTTNVGNTMVGFQTSEFIVSADQDESLYDNSLGYSNENAPGADRLRLVANLISVNTASLANTADFTAIAQYVDGNLVVKETDPQYAKLGDMMAASKFEESGNFVVKPFSLDTVPHSANSQLFVARVSPGIAYAQGHRVELVKTAPVDIPRAVTTEATEANIVTTNYGNYVLVNNFAGQFQFDKLQEVDLYDTAQQAVTLKNFSNLSVTGTKIGTATIRSVVHWSGQPGTPSAVYAVYLFNVRMNATKAFTQVRSIYFAGTTKAVADLTEFKIRDSAARSMVWPIGKSAVKRLTDVNGDNDTQFVFRQKIDSTLAINGDIALTLPTAHAGGSNRFPYGIGLLGDANEADFQVILSANAETVALTGQVTVGSGANTVTGASTNFTAQYSVGEYIKIGAQVRMITAITSATAMQVDANWTSAATTQPHSKYFPAGYVFPLTNSLVGTRTVTINTDTTATISVGLNAAGNLTAPVSVSVYANVLRYNASPAKKKINKSVLVKIDTSTNAGGTAGPWNLGLPDVHKIRAVYSGYTKGGSNYLNDFFFDTGMTDTHYDHGKLYLKPGRTIPASTFMVELDVFTQDTLPGVGFFSVESYPIDDANTANTNAITTAEIPTYVGELGGTYNLRDCIDFRPYKAATASLATTAGAASINPATTNNFNVDTLGTYCPTPDETFQADVEYYLGRKDIVWIGTNGQLKVKTGLPSTNPQTPEEPEDGMAIAILNVPPYPSVTTQENEALVETNKTNKSMVRDTKAATNVTLVTYRRYTMRDIGVLDQRLARMEYYTALSLLEKSATDIQVTDASGLNRFKNGIFVEPFTSHMLGEVSNPEYRIAIDSDVGIARPYFTEDRAEFDFVAAKSSQTKLSTRLVTLPFTSTVFANQPYATKFRNAAPVQFHWKGQADLFPDYDHNVDKVNGAAVQVTIDTASAWQDFANSPFGTEWGDWRTTSSRTNTSTSQREADVRNGTNVTTTTRTTTTSTEARTGTKLQVGTTSTEYNLGSFVEDISVQPYIRSREVAFYAWSVRPNTRLYVFFDDENISDFAAPGVRNGAVTDTSSDRYVTRTAAWGTPIRSNANGEVYGKFIIPEGRFRVGERNFKICDTADLELGGDSVTTSAVASFVGSNISTKTKSVTMTTISPKISTSSLRDTRSTTTSQTTTNVTFVPDPPPPVAPERERPGADNNRGGDGAPDPLAQMFRVNIDSTISGMFMTGLQVFFQKKPEDASVGVTVWVCEVLNGYPDNSRILPYTRTRLAHSAVNVSANATVPTTFNFEAPVYLANGKQYTFIIMPDGGHPDYIVWMAELGSTDVTTGTQVYSKPYIDTAFLSSNQSTWTALQTEYVKFNLLRAEFSTNSGLAAFENKNYDYFTTKDMSYVDTAKTIRPGDVVYASGNSTVSTANTAVSGYVEMYNPLNGKLHINTSTGNWTGKTYLQVHRPESDGGAISTGTLIASANLVSIDNLRVNALAPRFAAIEPPGTVLKWSVKGTNTQYTKDVDATNVILETETELFDYERIVASRSNEVAQMSGNKSWTVEAQLVSDTPYLSPVIDLVRSHAVVVGNEIDPLSFDISREYFNDGKVQTKYLSKPIVLAEGQDAEDLQVYLTAYRPSTSDILVYAKFLNAQDAQNITDKNWTKLQIDDPSNYSSTGNINDYRELLYKVPSAIPAGAPATSAYVDAVNGLTYKNADNSSYTGYKAFAIKVVLLSDSTSRVPRLNDIRALALQL